MKLAVRLYGVNTLGLPPEWPAESFQLTGAATAPQGWLTMTDAEFIAYKATWQPAFDAAMDAAPSDVAAAKEKKFSEIDSRTDELILQGMSFNGMMFSLSPNAREKMNNADGLRNDPAFTYPVVWNNIDDSATISLANATDLHNMYLTALATVRAHIDSGTAVKDLVRAATTVSAVNAVKDNR